MTADDITRNLRTTTTYSQTFPYTGLVERTELYQVSRPAAGDPTYTLIGKVTGTHASKTTVSDHPEVQFPYASRVVTFSVEATRADKVIDVRHETYNSSTFGLDGQSDHVGNVTLHYNRDKFNARVSYRFRTEFTRPQRPARAFTTNRGEGDLAFQTSYDFNDHIRIFVEGYGLLDEARDNYYGQDSLQGSYGVYGRNIQFGATYRF